MMPFNSVHGAMYFIRVAKRAPGRAVRKIVRIPGQIFEIIGPGSCVLFELLYLSVYDLDISATGVDLGPLCTGRNPRDNNGRKGSDDQHNNEQLNERKTFSCLHLRISLRKMTHQPSINIGQDKQQI
jgi:hypothetical protein